MDLQANEKIIYEGHPSWRSILGFYLKGFAITAVIAAVAAIGTNVADDEVNAGLVTLIAVLGGSLTVLVGFIKRVSTTYTITDQRLNIRKGIISRKVKETRLGKVQNVNFEQSVYQRFMQIGDVDFDTAAGDDYNFIFQGVSEPDEIVQKVDRATPAGDQA